MKLKSIAAAATVALTALSSQAAVWDWGTHDPLEVAFFVPATAPALSDIFTFSLTGASTVTSGFASVGVIGGTYSLFSNSDGILGNADDTFVGAWGSSTTATHAVSLTAGNYFYVVGGTVLSSGAYSISSAAVAAPVPEPETYALLGAGLGIVGFVASRRRRDY